MEGASVLCISVVVISLAPSLPPSVNRRRRRQRFLVAHPIPPSLLAISSHSIAHATTKSTNGLASHERA